MSKSMKFDRQRNKNDDKRFDLSQNPRFNELSKKKSKIRIDKRFASVLTDPKYATEGYIFLFYNITNSNLFFTNKKMKILNSKHRTLTTLKI